MFSFSRVEKLSPLILKGGAGSIEVDKAGVNVKGSMQFPEKIGKRIT